MAPRGRGKFSKPSRGGGKRFSRDVQPLDKDGNPVGMWRDPEDDIPTTTEEESSVDTDEEEEDEDDEPTAGPSSSSNNKLNFTPDATQQPQPELTREERRALAKAKKQTAIARKNQFAAQPGDLPPSESDESGNEDGEEDGGGDLPANPNHTAKSRSQAQAQVRTLSPDADASGATGAGDSTAQLSRRERKALEEQLERERYMKLHAEGKTDEARADLARLAIVRERREAERLRKEAEKEEKAQLARRRAEEREKKLAGAGGGKKKGKK